jgi:hypothetical protein
MKITITMDSFMCFKRIINVMLYILPNGHHGLWLCSFCNYLECTNNLEIIKTNISQNLKKEIWRIEIIDARAKIERHFMKWKQIKSTSWVEISTTLCQQKIQQAIMIKSLETTSWTRIPRLHVVKNDKRTHILENSIAIHEEKFKHNRWIRVHELIVNFKLFGCNPHNEINEALTT